MDVFQIALCLTVCTIMFWTGHICSGQRTGHVGDTCVCSINAKRWINTYDNSQFVLQLPCTYRLTDIESRNGCKMVVSAVTDNLFGFGTAVDLKGLQFSVQKGKYKIFGMMDDQGIMERNASTGHDMGFNLPVNIIQGDLDVVCYIDENNVYSVYVPLCDTILRYHSNGFALVGSIMGNAQVGQNLMCGNCDGEQNELLHLPEKVADSIHSMEEYLAAKLYYTSLQISGDTRQCIDYKSNLYRCHPREAVSVLRVCSQVLTGTSKTGLCLRMRAGRQQIYNTFFECVKASCKRRNAASKAGCLVIKKIAMHFTCFYQQEMNC